MRQTLEDLLRELRYAARDLRRSPLATIAAVLCLGLGIGIAAVVFSIADEILLRRLAVPNPHELVSLYQRADDGRGGFSSHAYPHYLHLRDHSASYKGIAAFSRIPVNARIGEPVERLITELVSNHYFTVLGVAPVLGRTFTADDGHVAVLGNRLWRERFNADSNVLGRKILLNAQPFTIIGVMPESFQSVVLDWGKPPQLWMPVTAASVLPDLPVSNPRSHWMLVVARLRDGVSIGQAQSEAEALSASFYELNPMRSGRFRPVVLRTQQARFWPGHRDSVVNYIGLLTAVAALTFGMACFNVASLLLGRAVRRQREIGIQIAIGSGRLRLARGLLIEAAVLAGSGAVAGLVFLSAAPALLNRFQNPFGIPLALTFSFDGRVLGFVFATAVFATLLVGLSPVRLAWRTDVASLIRTGGGGGPSGGFRLTDLLVAAQVAICLVALAGAGLFLRTLRHAQASDPMFDAGNALLVGVDLLSTGYDQQRGRALLRTLRDRVREAPGVVTAAYVKTVPLGGFRGARDVRIGGVTANVQANTVSPGYFAAAGLPLLRGRDFEERETASVVVNEQMAQRFWPGEDAVGKLVEAGQRFVVAGVVRDGRMRSFRDPQVTPCVYLPLEADYQRMITLYVRTPGNPLAAMAGVRSAMQGVDPSLPFEASTLQTWLDTALSKERLASAMLSLLGVFATVLAGIGLYGLISVAVSQRSREIAIRMALGARRAGVVGTVMSRFAVLLCAGAAAGAVGFAVLARFVERLLFGVGPVDAVALAGACVFLGVVAMLASAAPAIRAASTDPASVLREQ